MQNKENNSSQGQQQSQQAPPGNLNLNATSALNETLKSKQSRNQHQGSSPSKQSQVIRPNVYQNTFSGGRGSMGELRDTYIEKVENMRFLRKQSDNNFFEIFNKQKRKCPVLIPDSLIISSGGPSAWYFTSKKMGVVLKKNSDKLNALEAFKTIWRQSVLAQPEDFDDKKLTKQMLTQPSEQHKILTPIDENLKSHEIIPSETPMKVKSNLVSLKRIMRLMSAKASNMSVQELDTDLPYIGFVRFRGQPSRPIRPCEFFSICQERLGDVRMIQPYVQTRAQSMAATFLCEYSKLDENQPPQYKITKKQISDQLSTTMKNPKIRSVNPHLNSRIQEQAKIIVHFMEFTTKNSIKFARIKFLEGQDNNIYFIGIKNDLHYLPKNSRVAEDNDCSQIFGSNDVAIEKRQLGDNSSKNITKRAQVCFGDFCDFNIQENNKFLTYPGKKKEFENNFSKIPNKNRIYNESFNYQVTGLMIKKTRDNTQLANKILLRHKITNGSLSSELGNMLDETPKNGSTKNLLDDQQSSRAEQSPSKKILIQPEQLMVTDRTKKLGHIRRQLNTESYHSLYRTVTVCKQCFLIYSLIEEYFDEINKDQLPEIYAQTGMSLTGGPQKGKRANTSQGWVHSEKLLRQDDEVVTGGGMKNIIAGHTIHSTAQGGHSAKKFQNIPRDPDVGEDGTNLMNSKKHFLKQALTDIHGGTMSQSQADFSLPPAAPKAKIKNMRVSQKITTCFDMKQKPKMSYQINKYASEATLPQTAKLPMRSQMTGGAKKLHRQESVEGQSMTGTFISGEDKKHPNHKTFTSTFHKRENRRLDVIAKSTKRQQKEHQSPQNKLNNMKMSLGLSMQGGVLAKLDGRLRQTQSSQMAQIDRVDEERPHLNFYDLQKEEYKMLLIEASQNGATTVVIDSQRKTPRSVAKAESYEESHPLSSTPVPQSQGPNVSGVRASEELKNVIKKASTLRRKTSNDQLTNLLSQQKNVMSNVTSMFHYSNLEHIKKTVHHKVSTPKLPIMQDVLIQKYAMPKSFLKQMDMEKYCDNTGFDFNVIGQCKYSTKLTQITDKNFLIDQDTSMLYTVLSTSLLDPADDGHLRESVHSSQKSEFMPGQNQGEIRLNSNVTNYIVIGDLFDSFLENVDKYQEIIEHIHLNNQDDNYEQPSSQSADKQTKPQSRIILMNMPGQAFTYYKQSQILNNSYYVDCLDQLLYFLHETKQIDLTREPFCLVGFGNGSSIALYYCKSCQSYLQTAMLVNDTNDALKGVLLFNGFSYVDEMLRDSLSMAIQSFQNCPEDLYEYADFYYANLVRSTSNVQKYTKIPGGKTPQEEYNPLYHDDGGGVLTNLDQKRLNPIRKIDRINICKGILQNLSIKEKLKYLKLPIIYVYSKSNCFVHLKHADTICQQKGGGTSTQPNQGKQEDKSMSPKKKTSPNQDLEETANSMSTTNKKKKGTLGVSLNDMIHEEEKRKNIFIEGAHDVWFENSNKVQDILKEFCTFKMGTNQNKLTTIRKSIVKFED